ncbi:hypothetical protein [Haloarcula sp. CBA1131]|uniref:hypothetical protein n=1 Tax=Haloarcula sp. CBA1131 TaxID=1853686 RepID=UPI001CD97B6A|nr:hypothetical protein [Haloarcula sp. CBA1131]
MTEWIVDTRGGVYHQCDTEYQRLAGHWARNQSCTYRDLDDTHHETIRGSSWATATWTPPTTVR